MTIVDERARDAAMNVLFKNRPEIASIAAEDRDKAGSLGAGATDTRRYLLVFQFAVFNLSAFALLGAAYMQGWLAVALKADNTGLSVAISAVFLGGLVTCALKIWRFSRELNCVRKFDPCRQSWAATYLAEVAGRGSGCRAITASALRVKLANRISSIRHIANSLVLLGLIGTVIGFVIALSGVDASAAGDIRNITPMVSNLLRGMSVALFTTLVGAILNLWLTVNYHILAGGAVKLLTGVVALGEANARLRSV